MENKTQQTKNKVDFTNLKSLNRILGGEINLFFVNIKKSKENLDNYCKNLKNISNKAKVTTNIQDNKKIINNNIVVNKEENTDKIVKNQDVRKNTSNFSNRKNDSQFNKNTNRTFNKNDNRNQFDKNGKFQNNRNKSDNFSKNNKQNYQTNNKNKDNSISNRPLGPKSTFVPRGEVISFTPKADTSKREKSKQRNYDQEKKGLNIKAKIRMGVVDYNMSDDPENEYRIGRVRSKNKKQKSTIQPEKINVEHAMITTENLTVKILSEKIGKPASEIIKKFMLLGMMLNINSPIDFSTAELVAGEFGITLEQKLEKTAEEKLQENVLELGSELKKRPPIVTVMGHVDHGKTSLLDAIKKTDIISTEAGGITQHIGAYSVNVNDRKITFIDTPGHEAFTSMRARGAEVTDIAVLVVAADDGIMPQTVEAIHHIKDANVPMIVAINKIDKPEANIERIKQQLTEYEVIPEEWGGDVICVPISAKQGIGIDKLLEMILLVADVRELKAYYDCPAIGTVIESKVDRGRGIVANIIIKEGILKIGDYVVCGLASGRVRAMTDYLGNNVKQAEPSMAVSLIGLDKVPEAGEKVYVVDEKLAKNILYERQTKIQEEKAKQNNGATLEDFLQQSADSELKILKIIVKADVNGTSEAVKQTLEKIKNDEVIVKCIHSGVGSITESDVLLAKASNALIVGFNIKPEAKAKTLAERNGVSINLYKIIYEAVDEITNIINGMQTPKFEEHVVGRAEIRKVFKISAIGNIAGCYVLNGTISRKNKVRVLRDNQEIAIVTLDNLQQNKDDVKEVREGFECGIKLKNYNDIKELDILEFFEEVQIN